MYYKKKSSNHCKIVFFFCIEHYDRARTKLEEFNYKIVYIFIYWPKISLTSFIDKILTKNAVVETHILILL